MDPHTQRAEAERWLGIAAKLLTARDFLGSKTFAIRAREADPNNAISDQILAVVDTVLAGEKRVNANQQPDWYAVLQLPRLVRDPDLIADHYRRLVFCLNPERNRFPFADYALQLVMDAWSVLSDPSKKWLFDNELAMYLQQGEPIVAPTSQPITAAAAAGGSSVGSPVAVAVGSGGSQLNTFQFFQPQPPQPQQQHLQQQQHQQPQQQMWQQQQQQINQRDFMPIPSLQQQQIPPQWQMRDPTPSKGGERNKGVVNGIGIGVGVARVATTMSPMSSTQNTTRPFSGAPQPAFAPAPPARPPSPLPQPQPTPPMSTARVGVTATVRTAVPDGNFGTAPTSNTTNNSNNDGNINGVDASVADEGVVEEIESFWTACPYCFYIYEYQKMYQECTLRCQNCRRGFHAVQIPNPPPISSIKDGGGGKEKEQEEGKNKDKNNANSFCCWGFFPLGFSMAAWKKQHQNQIGSFNGSSNWVPFSPMFTSPVADGGGGFKWFDNGDGNAFVGPKNDGKKKSSWVYIDDDDDAFLEQSESSDLDSSDGDWRTYNQEKGKKKKKRKVSFAGRKRGRPKRGGGVNQVEQNVASGGGVSVGGEKLVDGSDAQEVVFGLAAGDKSDASKTVPATLVRKLTRRSVKDVGRLDLNVEFNNDGEEHAPTTSAVNGEEDVIENIGFFEGLDEFLSTLPILNVGGDGKAKPS